MTDSMRAIGAVGGLPIDDPGALVDIEAPLPELRPRDVLVRVEAVSVNPVDTKVRASLDRADAPRILGFDAAGTVQAIGHEVTTLAIGEEVWYAGELERPGSNAELQAVDERLAAPRPRTLSAAEAAALPLTTITAWESLHERLRVPASSDGALLVLGGAGGVGSILIQLARHHAPRLRILATASRPESRAWVSDLGADSVIDHHELVEQAAAAAPSGIAYAFTAHSTGNVDALAELLTPFGDIVAIDDPDGLDLLALKQKSIAWHWELMFTRSMFQTADMDRQRRLLEEVAALVDGGRVRTTATETITDFSAAGLRKAHALVESGQMVGKVVVTR